MKVGARLMVILMLLVMAGMWHTSTDELHAQEGVNDRQWKRTDRGTTKSEIFR